MVINTLNFCISEVVYFSLAIESIPEACCQSKLNFLGSIIKNVFKPFDLPFI